MNITRNITANERINRSRYPWMNDEHGQPLNHYDRGFLKNILEFWAVAGYRVDYFAEFDVLPAKIAREKGLLLGDSSGTPGTNIECPPDVSLLRKDRPEKIPPIASKKRLDEEPYPPRSRSPSSHKHVTVSHLPLPSATTTPTSCSDSHSPLSIESPRATYTKSVDSNRPTEQGGRRSARAYSSPSSELQDRLCPRSQHYGGGSRSHDHVSSMRTDLDLGPPLSRCSSRHSSPSSVQGGKRARVDS